MKTIKVGVIGAGPDRGWARTAHVPALRALPQYEISAVGTTREESAREAARLFGAPHAFTDARRLAAHPDVDIVAVTVKVPHHAELIRAALDAGKHVLSEWPLALTTAEAESLAEEAGRAGMHDRTRPPSPQPHPDTTARRGAGARPAPGPTASARSARPARTDLAPSTAHRTLVRHGLPPPAAGDRATGEPVHRLRAPAPRRPGPHRRQETRPHPRTAADTRCSGVPRAAPTAPAPRRRRPPLPAHRPEPTTPAQPPAPRT
jgi:hypothetical protein